MLFLDERVRQNVSELAREFQTAKPFRHVVIDNFLNQQLAEEMLTQFPAVKDPSTLLSEYGDPNPKSAIDDVRGIGGIYRELDDYIQTNDFLQLMSEITGIPDLKYDPWYYGAGTHENFNGAGLDPHYDFNIHPRTAQHRRINAIVYLSKNWNPDWRGAICFHTDPWDVDNDQIKEVVTTFNRCVIFETTERSWHSVPTVTLPPDKRHLSRKSFTIYLYTDTRPDDEMAPEHSTVYVQPNLSSHIKPGRVLTQKDVDEIKANIERRNQYLKHLYKREYRFSDVVTQQKQQLYRFSDSVEQQKQHINILSDAVVQQKQQISNLERKSYVPLLGYAKIKEVQHPLFIDGHMGKRLEFTTEMLRPVSSAKVVVFRHDTSGSELNMSFRIGSHSVEGHIPLGVSHLQLDFGEPISGEACVVVEADRTFSPDGDERQLSVVFERLELAH